jgi:anaerobic magnesium-protoporphyrin IX monomethyl ester cyclase
VAKIIPIVSNKFDSPAPVISAADEKYLVMAENMKGLARTQPQKNLTSVQIDFATKKTSVVFVLMPPWGKFFPPYNIARLSAITRAAGYNTSVFDINIKSYLHFKNNELVDYDPWSYSREHVWASQQYDTELRPHIEPLFKEYIEKIVSLNPDVVGFSLYYTNEQSAKWLATELKRRLPNIVILAGGPQAQKSYFHPIDEFDHIVQGEGEALLLEILDRVEHGQPIGDRYIKQPSGQRIDLDSLPFPDYTDYDLNDYDVPNGISAELSRGCVAKCTFCSETLFWKFRGRLSGSILDEIEHQYKTHNINTVWFIDSLVNGNLKELRAFAQGVIDRGLKISWQGYCRCDDRMDLNYYRDLKASGCFSLNYGVESGSQKVLDAMKKNIKIAEIEQNLRDTNAVGIKSDINWLIGFPNEDPGAFADTMTLMWRIRNFNLSWISSGVTMMQDPETDVGINYHKYDILKDSFLHHWLTSKLDNTCIHRKIRIKTFELFLLEINIVPVIQKPFTPVFSRTNLSNTYHVKYESDTLNEIEYEQFDYAIIKPGINRLADSVVNEIWPVLRLLWRTRGAYETVITFDPVLDGQDYDRFEFDYTATHKFKIDNNGNWTADFEYKLVLPENPWDPGIAPAPMLPWVDHSFEYRYHGTGCWI